MKNKKGFTLIELLAVIVILAIIALIAVPIVLNMITQARRSAARSAALGYIDAIEYNNGFANAEMDGYTLITGTKNVSEINVKMKGKKPDSGSVTITNDGKVESATLCINGYNVTYDGDARVGSKCDGNNNQQTQVPTISTCPGCKFIYTTTELTVGTSTEPDGTTNDYTSLNKSYFLGLIINDNTKVIERAFACGIENGTAFCLEGADVAKYKDNVEILNTVFPGCNADSNASNANCNGNSVGAFTSSLGSGNVYNSSTGSSYVDNVGRASCYEL